MVLLEEGTDLTKGKTWPVKKWTNYLNILFFRMSFEVAIIHLASASYQWLSGKHKSNPGVG